MSDTKNFSILVVDDEIKIRESIKENLEIDGFKVLTAAGGYEALDIFKNNSIDFIVTDIRMPSGSGDMLLKEVRKINPKRPVIVMVTGYSEMKKEEAIELGALDLLPKPIDLDLIESYIWEALEARGAS